MPDTTNSHPAPDNTVDIVKQFFRDFAEGSNTFSAELVSAQFSDPFMVADPNGVIRVVNLADFVAGIPARRDFFQSPGFQDVHIELLQQTRIDAPYVMAKAGSRMRFAKTAHELVELESESTYILLAKNDHTKIIFYTTHEDLLTILHEHGLLPSD